MKDLRVFLPVFLLILIVFLLTGCGGFVPSPGATDEDVTTISGQIKMPLICCDTLSETAEGISRETTCDESELWNPTAGAIVELKSAEKGKCNKVIDEATADDTGYYLFEDVQPGLYIITAKCPVTGNEGFLLKDVAEKFSGVALDAGIPDCTSTALALVIEKINNCYNDWYQCFGKLTASKIYNKVEDIADAIGTVDIPAIKTHADFGNYCEGGDEDLVDLICAWSCCGGPGATGGGGPTPGPTPGPCDNNLLPIFNKVDYYDGVDWTEIASGDNITLYTGTEYTLRVDGADNDDILNPLSYRLYIDTVIAEEDTYPDPGPMLFTGTPQAADIGEYSFNVGLLDGCGETLFGAFDVNICPSEPYLVVNIDNTRPCAGTCANVTSIDWKTDDEVIATFEPPYESNGSDGLELDWVITGDITFDPATGDICWPANDLAARVVELDTIQFTYYDECDQDATHKEITLTISPLLKSLEIIHDPIEICVGETVDLCDYITAITATFEDDSTSTDITCAELGFPIISNNLSFSSPSSITGDTVGAGTVVAQYTGPCGETKRDTIEVTVRPALKSLEIIHDPIEICVGETVDLCDYITAITATFEDDSTSTDITCAELGFPIISNNLSFSSPSSITGDTVGAGTVVAQYTGPCGETKRDTIEVTVRENIIFTMSVDYNIDTPSSCWRSCPDDTLLYWWGANVWNDCQHTCSYCCCSRDYVKVIITADKDLDSDAQIVLDFSQLSTSTNQIMLEVHDYDGDIYNGTSYDNINGTVIFEGPLNLGDEFYAIFRKANHDWGNSNYPDDDTTLELSSNLPCANEPTVDIGFDDQYTSN
jgi:hypothetical protein